MSFPSTQLQGKQDSIPKSFKRRVCKTGSFHKQRFRTVFPRADNPSFSKSSSIHSTIFRFYQEPSKTVIRMWPGHNKVISGFQAFRHAKFPVPEEFL
ncbi:hypothetical protein PoB_006620000 [Plakobranchus ocellatus]|uniref:Uncharacterized protein n=1 Tax=Plakobranchus ocellatus TaxID=259542 RepID=A0AAV4D6K4_9GAST|nr:hypothetical protein PoB_006620000 [Plakobranchus ocellatus]